MLITGALKQEKKIEDMVTVVENMYAGISPLSVKGVFRFAIDTALKDFSASNWKDFSKEPPEKREKFFGTICDHAIPRLVKLGFPKVQAGMLKTKLVEMNTKYVKG